MIASDLFLRRVLLSGVLALSLAPKSAHAEGGEQRAVVLFEEGRRLARDGRCAEAIAPLLESLRHAEGVGPLLNLGNCYELLGRTASAHRYFMLAAQAAAVRGDPRRDEATARARALANDLPLLVVHVPQEMRASAEVRIDSEVLPRERWGLPTPVDPGGHAIEVLAPPGPPQATIITLKAPGDRVEWTATPPVKRAAIGVFAPFPKMPKAAPPRSGPSLQRTLGLASGGVGLAGLGVGALAGVLALNAHGSLVDRCPSYPTCPMTDRPRLDELNSRAETSATISTIGFIASAVFLAGGAVLFFTASQGAER